MWLVVFGGRNSSQILPSRLQLDGMGCCRQSSRRIGLKSRICNPVFLVSLQKMPSSWHSRSTKALQFSLSPVEEAFHSRPCWLSPTLLIDPWLVCRQCTSLFERCGIYQAGIEKKQPSFVCVENVSRGIVLQQSTPNSVLPIRDTSLVH